MRQHRPDPAAARRRLLEVLEGNTGKVTPFPDQNRETRADIADPGDTLRQFETALQAKRFNELRTEYDSDDRILWYRMDPIGRPCATVGVMEDIRALQAVVREAGARTAGSDAMAVKWMVLASAVPGVFNLGGNLGLFADLIEARDRKLLENYGYLSIDVIHANALNLGLPLISVSLVQGDALGGGFEAALSSNVIVAERSAKFGLPEIVFGLFPGMGAYSFLARRVGQVAAERMIMSGRLYTAEELHETGIVDVLAEDGCGEAALREHVARSHRRHQTTRSLYSIRERANPLTHQEMMDIVGIWVDTALGLSPPDIRRMRRLAAAQDRRMQRTRG